MRKNIEALIKITRGEAQSSSLPFVITTVYGERKTVWFNFVGRLDGKRYRCNIVKIFLLSEHNNIETFDVNINIETDVNNYNENYYDRDAYMVKFQEQFETNQFDDVLELLSTAEPSPFMDLYETVIDYFKKPRTMSCKHCGSDVGFFAKLSGVQYYTNAGEDDGYTVDAQNSSVYCRACKKRVCTYSEFQKLVSSGI